MHTATRLVRDVNARVSRESKREAAQAVVDTAADTPSSLTGDLKEFPSAIPINDFLARLLLSRKTKSLPAAPPPLPTSPINFAHPFPRSTANSIPKEDLNAPVEIIFDMPGLERDREPLQEPAHADVRT